MKKNLNFGTVFDGFYIGVCDMCAKIFSDELRLDS